MGKDGQRGSGLFCVVISTCCFARNGYLTDRTYLGECNSSKHKNRQELSQSDVTSRLFFFYFYVDPRYLLDRARRVREMCLRDRVR